MKTQITAILMATPLLASTALGQITVVNELSEETHSYNSNTQTNFAGAEANLQAVAPLGVVNIMFSELGEQVVEVAWEAPAGRFIEIDVPEGFTDFYVEFSFSAGSVDGFQHNTFVPSLGMAALSGDLFPLENALDIETYVARHGANSRFRSSFYLTDLTPGLKHRMTSVSTFTTFPENFNYDYNSTIQYAYIYGYASVTGAAEIPADPGQWIRLVCIGDLNSDGAIDTADLGILIGQFGTSGPDADLNADGIVDTADLGILIGAFGDVCD